MIGRLSGTLLEKQAPFLLIDVAGVGYEVQVPMTSIYPLPELGAAVVLHTHLSISENAHQLFGFYSEEERRLFRTLIKVNGVGPKMALAILSGMPANEFVACVRQDNVAALVKVPGVGKKTAERLIIEVKDRLKEWGEINDQLSNGLNNATEVARNEPEPAVVADAESALVALGYKPTQATQMIYAAQKLEPVTNSESLIRLALKSGL